MRLSVIVATIGRPTLGRALESIRPGRLDEVIVVSRPPNEDVRWLAQMHDCRYYDYPHSHQVAGGAAERQYGIEKAKGDYLVFLDDDDVMADNALEIIREEIALLDSPLPLLFRVEMPGGFIWGHKGPSLRLGEVTGSQFVPPNDPDKLVPWPIDPSGDQPFIDGVIENWGGFKAVDRVIIRVRPEQIS